MKSKDMMLEKLLGSNETAMEEFHKLNFPMHVVCFDLEGIFAPELWIEIANATGIEDLKITTRDEPDYDKLMKRRIQILRDNEIGFKKIQEIVAKTEPLNGAEEFLNWARSIAQVAVVTDNYKEFLPNLMKKLGFPLCICHDLEIDDQGYISNYNLRIDNMKLRAIQSFKNLNYTVIAAGDSYNDIEMLKEADYGVLFGPPENVVEDHPELPVVNNYDDLKRLILENLKKD